MPVWAIIVLGIAYAVSNIYVMHTLTVEEMRDRFISRQCIVGIVCTNIYYAPAWVFKLLRNAIDAIVK